MSSKSNIGYPLLHPFLFIFQLVQWVLGKLLSPEPPNPSTRLSRPKIAVIGAGITGVTSAAHCIGHGFDVVIFEAGDRESLGGIWSVCLRLVAVFFVIDSLTDWTYRRSTTPRVFRSIRSCIDFTHRSSGIAVIPIGNRSLAKSSSSGSVTDSTRGPSSIHPLKRSIKMKRVVGY
jgi:hypothetical protein